MRRDLSKMARGPAAEGAFGRDGPPGLADAFGVEGRPAAVPALLIADLVPKGRSTMCNTRPRLLSQRSHGFGEEVVSGGTTDLC